MAHTIKDSIDYKNRTEAFFSYRKIKKWKGKKRYSGVDYGRSHEYDGSRRWTPAEKEQYE